MGFYKNSPSTDSPINATNLRRGEAYSTATAGSDGDFDITIPANDTLTTNDYIELRLPAATTGSSNARISIDGGSNYFNIKDKNGNQLLASIVEDDRHRFYYDGTDFIFDNNSIEIATKLTQKGSLLGNISDDAAISFTPSQDIGVIIIHSRSNSYAQTVWGMYSYRVTATGNYIYQMNGGSSMETSTSVLNGTTGSDAKVTISAASDGKIYIENRYGTTISVTKIEIGQ